ncbi:MAG: 1-deoxy-D-xylulose-5-phosphate reductoisomerase [Solirubrobacterales bacterium]
MARRIVVLGSTGSIGVQALEVAAEAPGVEVVGLSAASSWEPLVAQARATGARRIALADPAAAQRARSEWDGEVLEGPEGLVELIASSGADMVLNALVGSAGLAPTVTTLAEGIDLALANKESLVVGGELVMSLAEGSGARLVPVDSEHSAIAQLVEAEQGQRPGSIERIVLTASGGPFRGRSRDELEQVTVEEALRHPTWEMGGKITIDSATLFNKGLELIEAHHLFTMPYERIDVVVHPQSIVHSCVTLSDGALLAHLGHPDMKVPIAYALLSPDRSLPGHRPLDLAEVRRLDFEPVDEEAFPALSIAREAGMAGGTAPAVMNAANEIAVAAFLDGRLPFSGITSLVASVLDEVESGPASSFDALVDADRQARTAAERLVA